MERTYAEYAARQAMELLAIDSPTGFTARAADWVQRAFEELGYTARHTAKGGVLVDLGGRGEGLLLEAHADTLGGMVAEVKNSGRLRLTPLGGMRAENGEAENVRVYTRGGRVLEGTFQLCNASIHVNGQYGDTKRTFDSCEVVLDEDVKSAEETRTLGVEVGDVVCFEPRTRLTASGYIKSRFLDDKLSAGMLLELARRLDRMAALPQNILLVFQPAEETTGGARDLCQTGIFQEYGVEAIFGMHLWPDLPSGVIASRRNEMMSRSCEVSVTITGRSSHIAKAEEGLDALAAGVEFYRRAVALEKELSPDIYRLLKFGRMESGTVRNAVSGKTVLLGSLRAFQDEVFFGLQEGLRAIGRDIEKETGCTVDVHANDGYPAVWNPDELFDRVRNAGVDFEILDKPVMISEDFSWYQRHLPALFFFLGCGPAPALHADDFTFDESILTVGADFWKKIAAKL